MSSPKIQFASNIGLDRVDCAVCKEETLHRHGECVHCGSYLQPAADRRYTVRQQMLIEASMRQARARGMQRIKGER